MKKILLITYYFPPQIGGGEGYLYNIYRRLPIDKLVVLADDKGGDDQIQFDKEQSFKIYRSNFFSGKFKPTWRPMIKLVKNIIQKEKIAIIHFGHYAHYVLLARILKMSYLVYIQGTDLTSYSSSWFGRWLMKSNLRPAELIITNSHFLEDKIAVSGIDVNKIKVMHPGLDLEQYDFTQHQKKATAVVGGLKLCRSFGAMFTGTTRFDIMNYHTSENAKIILSVGRLVKLKGFDLVISVLPRILKQIPNAVYVIVGEGEERENLQRLAVEQGVENKVIFTGEIRDKKELSKYYASADVYVGPSLAEGFGIVFLEARAFGLPIVASDVGGVREAVGDRGVLIEVNDLDGLAQNIIKVLSQENKHQPGIGFGWEEKAEKLRLMFE